MPKNIWRVVILPLDLCYSKWFVDCQHQHQYQRQLSASAPASKAASASLSHMQNHWSTLDLLDQNLHSSPIPRGILGSLNLRSSASGHQNHLEDVLKLRWLGPTPTVRFCGFEVCLRICFWYILESCWVPQGSH